ncbi:hypothetical protein RI367_002009 [Sorochytrium milnesiophthora]
MTSAMVSALLKRLQVAPFTQQQPQQVYARRLDVNVDFAQQEYQSRPPQLRFTLPLGNSSKYVQRLSAESTTEDFLYNIKQEFPRSRVLVTHRFSRTHVLPELEDVSLSALVKGDYVVWMDGVPFFFDTSKLMATLRAKSNEISLLQQSILKLQQLKSQIDSMAGQRLRTIIMTGGSAIVGELGLIIYLTYELGWDLMEPTSYLIGLGTVIMGTTFYAFLRREYTYENAAIRISSLLHNQVVGRRWKLSSASERTSLENCIRIVQRYQTLANMSGAAPALSEALAPAQSMQTQSQARLHSSLATQQGAWHYLATLLDNRKFHTLTQDAEQYMVQWKPLLRDFLPQPSVIGQRMRSI